MKVLHFKEFLDRYADASLAMCEAIRELSPEGGRLDIEPGRYDFYPQMAREGYYCISNNDQGLKRIAMPLIHARNIVIDGHGAEFHLFGYMMPVVLDHSENILLQNFTVEYDRPFYTEGWIEEANEREITVKIDAERFPYTVRDGEIHFSGYEWDVTGIHSFLEYAPDTRDLVPGTADFYTLGRKILAEELPGGRVRLRLAEGTFPFPMQAGNIAVISHATRNNPGIFGTESRDLRYENVTIHHCEGMAFIHQLCENIRLERCRVVPSEGRMISAAADATHFVNCTGTVELKDCAFFSQLDDATNVHGIYTLVKDIVGNRLYLRYMHFQQEGIPLYRPGDTIRLLKCASMESFGQAQVRKVETINNQVVCVEVDELPRGAAVGDGAENISRMPTQTTITGCTTGRNRARSFLISCTGKVRIEDNDLHPNGAAVWISGDCNYWYESGPVSEVEICNNRIVNTHGGIAGWGRAAIEIVPEIVQRKAYYHGSVTVRGNEFVQQQSEIVHALCVENLLVSDNRIFCEQEDADDSAPIIVAEHCRVQAENNTVNRTAVLVQ